MNNDIKGTTPSSRKIVSQEFLKKRINYAQVKRDLTKRSQIHTTILNTDTYLPPNIAKFIALGVSKGTKYYQMKAAYASWSVNNASSNEIAEKFFGMNSFESLAYCTLIKLTNEYISNIPKPLKDEFLKMVNQDILNARQEVKTFKETFND